MSGWVRIPETWFEDEAVEGMSTEAIVLHLSALADCARHARDGRLPRRALRRLWPCDDQSSRVTELVIAGWWDPRNDGWYLVDWEDHILSAVEIDRRRATSRESSERYRRHKAGDHSMCSRCSAVRDQSRDASRGGSRDRSVIDLRSDPTRRGGEEERGGSADSAGAPPARRLPSPHAFGSDCCPLPPQHPIHEQPQAREAR